MLRTGGGAGTGGVAGSARGAEGGGGGRGLGWTSIFFLTANFDELRYGTSGTVGGNVTSGVRDGSSAGGGGGGDGKGSGGSGGRESSLVMITEGTGVEASGVSIL